jgi:hypothetical protein
MLYWYRPSIHLCESPDADRTLCGTEVTGAAPTVRPFPKDATPSQYFSDRDAEVCEGCERIHTSLQE